MDMELQMRELGRRLEALGMQCYFKVLVDNGFESWEHLEEIREVDMCKLGIKRGHRRKLQRQIATCRGLSRNVPLAPPSPQLSSEPVVYRCCYHNQVCQNQNNNNNNNRKLEYETRSFTCNDFQCHDWASRQGITQSKIGNQGWMSNSGSSGVYLDAEVVFGGPVMNLTYFKGVKAEEVVKEEKEEEGFPWGVDFVLGDE